MHVTSSEETHSNASCESAYKPEVAIEDPPIIDFSLPITQTYLNHMKQRGLIVDTGGTDEVNYYWYTDKKIRKYPKEIGRIREIVEWVNRVLLVFPIIGQFISTETQSTSAGNS